MLSEVTSLSSFGILPSSSILDMGCGHFYFAFSIDSCVLCVGSQPARASLPDPGLTSGIEDLCLCPTGSCFLPLLSKAPLWSNVGPFSVLILLDSALSGWIIYPNYHFYKTSGLRAFYHFYLKALCSISLKFLPKPFNYSVYSDLLLGSLSCCL